MGLLNRIKQRVGTFTKSFAGSIAGRLAASKSFRSRAGGFFKGLAKRFTKSDRVRKFASAASVMARRNPTIAIAAAGVTGSIAAYGVGKKLGRKAREKRRRRTSTAPSRTPQPTRTKTKANLLSTVARVGASAVGGAAAAYAIEKAAEKLGVRGGAGFIGKRKTTRKKRTTKRRKSRCKRKSASRRVSFTTRSGQRVSFNVGGKKRKRRTKKRYKGKLSRTEATQIERLIRKSLRD